MSLCDFFTICTIYALMFENTDAWKVFSSPSESISTHCACGKHKNTNLAWRDKGLIVVIRKIKSSHMVGHFYLPLPLLTY